MVQAELEPEDIDPTISAFHGAIKRTWDSFCATTSIHGLKFTRDRGTNKYVRFIWIVITVVMFLCSVAMVTTFYFDYRSNPTRMNVENDHTPISSLLFPGVTVCPVAMFNIEKTIEYVESLILPEGIDSKRIIELLMMNYGFINDEERFDMKDLEVMEELLKLNNLDPDSWLRRMRWDCDDLLFRCRYQWETVNCLELFQVSRSFFGYCCSFNINQTGVIPTKRYAEPGLRGGLSIMLYYNDSYYNRVHSYSHGFTILMHEEMAFPSGHAISKFVPLNEEVFIAIRPVQTFCSDAVKRLSIPERNCVFPYEIPMRFLPAYVAANCELNCRVQNMVKICGCLTFFFDNDFTDDPTCSFKDIPCLVENFADIVGRFRNTQCSCPNTCEIIDYDVQQTSAPIDLNIPTIDNFYKDLKKDYSIVHIFMNSQVYRRIRRDLLTNSVTLVSNWGSAFSLFVGMSMVSAVEIVYYFTFILRKNYLQEKKAREKRLFIRSDIAKS